HRFRCCDDLWMVTSDLESGVPVRSGLPLACFVSEHRDCAEQDPFGLWEAVELERELSPLASVRVRLEYAVPGLAFGEGERVSVVEAVDGAGHERFVWRVHERVVLRHAKVREDHRLPPVPRLSELVTKE